jgi:transposase
VPAKANAQQQMAFEKTYQRLKRRHGQEAIYFVDSVHPCHQTRLSYGWIAKGERKAIATTAKPYRLNFMGGICLSTHRVVYQQSDKINAQTIQPFLKTCRQVHPTSKRIHIIWDNAGYHRSKDMAAYAKALNIKLHYLPPYSPNLNPIERLWKLLHERVSYNRYYEKFADFRSACLDFFKTIGRQKKLLRSRITDNFQIIHSPMFAS